MDRITAGLADECVVWFAGQPDPQAAWDTTAKESINTPKPIGVLVMLGMEVVAKRALETGQAVKAQTARALLDRNGSAD